MRSLCNQIVVLAVVSLPAGWAVAQQAQTGPEGFGLFGGLLLNEGVQKELKLSDRQITRINQVFQQVSQQHRQAFQELRQLDRGKAGEKIVALTKSLAQETAKQMNTVLTPEQANRLKQIDLQQRGLRAFGDPEVDKRLQLSAKQKQQIKAVGDAAAKEMRRIFQEATAGNSQEREKNRIALYRQTIEKSMAVLTPDQQEAWKELTGEPFEVKFDPPAARRASGQEKKARERDQR